MAQQQNTGSLTDTDFSWKGQSIFGQPIDSIDTNQHSDISTSSTDTTTLEPTFETSEDFKPEDFGKNNAPKFTKEKPKTKPTTTPSSVVTDDDDDDDDEVVALDKADATDDEEDEFGGVFGDQKPKVKPKETVATGEGEGEGENESENEVEDAEGEEDDFYTVIAAKLKETGIITGDIPEGKLTEDQVLELTQAEIDKGIEEALNDYKESLKADQDTIEFLKFKKDGGNTADFLRVYGQAKLPTEEQLKNPKVQEAFMRDYLEDVEGLEGEDVEERLEFLTEEGKGRLAKAVAKAYTQKKEAIDKAKAELLQSQEDAKKTRIENAKKFKETISKTVAENDVIKDIKLSADDKKKLGGYITNATIKDPLNPSNYLTPLQADLRKVWADPQSLALLAKFLQSDMKIDQFEVAKATEKTKEVKQSLKQALNGQKVTTNRKRKDTPIFNLFD